MSTFIVLPGLHFVEVATSGAETPSGLELGSYQNPGKDSDLSKHLQKLVSHQIGKLEYFLFFVA